MAGSLWVLCVAVGDTFLLGTEQQPVPYLLTHYWLLVLDLVWFGLALVFGFCFKDDPM